MDEDSVNNALSKILPTVDTTTTTPSEVRTLIEKELDLKEGSLKKYKKRIRDLLLVQLKSIDTKKEKAPAKKKQSAKKKNDGKKKKVSKRAVVEDSDVEQEESENDEDDDDASFNGEDDNDDNDNDGDSLQPTSEEENENISDEKEVIPPKKKRKRKTTPAKKNTTSTKTQKESARLQAYKNLAKACSILNPTLYRKLNSASSEAEQIEIIQEKLDAQEIDYTKSKPTKSEIATAKKEKEREKELDGIDTSLIIEGRGRRSGRGRIDKYVPPAKKKKTQEEENEDIEVNEEEKEMEPQEESSEEEEDDAYSEAEFDSDG